MRGRDWRLVGSEARTSSPLETGPSSVSDIRGGTKALQGPVASSGCGMDQRGYRRQPQASVSTLIRTGGLDALRCAVGLASSAAPHSLSSGSGPLMLAPAELELDACKRSVPDATYILYSNTALLSQLAAKNFTRVAKGHMDPDPI
ncbi:hypothetical protein CFAM422_007905 [Trichoderma lentiforme]|uniref:Uncharacterized protein n=1 Tax=Trichoderma lentiforme TaxID=1567552 RepID=A0A9P4XCX4_9HYPO|nr:hypothetical protein CFAM422_007905 [Trichoderma lentiforme]